MKGLTQTAILYQMTDSVDPYGQPSLTPDAGTTVQCRFFTSKNVIRIAGQSLYGETTLQIMLDGSITVRAGDILISSELGYIGTFRIDSVTPSYSHVSLHHWTCDIAKVNDEVTPEAITHSSVLGEMVLGYWILGES